MAASEASSPHEPDQVIDLRSEAPGPAPVKGAQWNERRRRWEVWDDAVQAWMIVGDEPGERTLALDDTALPPLLARELLHADEIDAPAHHVVDITRTPPPPIPVPGAQWNEVAARWERWDQRAGAWVEAVVDARSRS